MLQKTSSKKFSLALIFFSVFVLCLVQKAESREVVTLTDFNFESLTSDGKWLIDFFAPWCPHCQQLEPIFEEAATTIRHLIPGVKLASVDCTSETTLCERFEVDAYPTIKYFRKGLMTPYEGGREVQDFVRFAKQVTSPPVASINSMEDLNRLKKNPVSFLLFYTASSDLEGFSQLAEKYQDSIPFGATSDRKIASMFDQDTSFGIAWFSDTKPEIYTDSSSFESHQVEAWIIDRKLPHFPSLDASSWRTLIAKKKLLVLGAFTAQQTKSPLFNTLKEISMSQSPLLKQFSYGWLDSVKFAKFVSSYIGSHSPAFWVLDADQQLHWFNSSIPHKRENIEQFLDDIRQGKVSGSGPGTGFLGRFTHTVSELFSELAEDPVYLGIVVAVFACLVGVTVYLITGGKEEAVSSEGEKVKSD